jgi:hypothetical protein
MGQLSSRSLINMHRNTTPDISAISVRFKDLPLIIRRRQKRIRYLWADCAHALLGDFPQPCRKTIQIHLLSEDHNESPAVDDRVIMFDHGTVLGLGIVAKLGQERELPAYSGYVRPATVRLQPQVVRDWHEMPWARSAVQEIDARRNALDKAGLTYAESFGMVFGTFSKDHRVGRAVSRDFRFSGVPLGA